MSYSHGLRTFDIRTQNTTFSIRYTRLPKSAVTPSECTHIVLSLVTRLYSPRGHLFFNGCLNNHCQLCTHRFLSTKPTLILSKVHRIFKRLRTLIYAAKTPLLAVNLLVFQIGSDAKRMQLHPFEFSDSTAIARWSFIFQRMPKQSLPTLRQ